MCLPNSHDIVAKIEAPDMETIKRVISEKIRALKAIKTTTTMIAQISA
ncbi:MAG: Lrp/AsnC ligand binding domain-containing protein [Promethearchaeota archaeon]